jgi:uncharacterized NAD(P)/FAD-binding protein YdhS
MAPRIAAAIDALIDAGRLEALAARVVGYRACVDGAGAVEATLATRSSGPRRFSAAWVINCTGPRRDLGSIGTPLIAELRTRGLMRPDALGLGLETDDGALLGADGRPSDWLFAVGPLTCPAWWEIVAVPEITVQVDALAAALSDPDFGGPARRPLTSGEFLDLGAGI